VGGRATFSGFERKEIMLWAYRRRIHFLCYGILSCGNGFKTSLVFFPFFLFSEQFLHSLALHFLGYDRSAPLSYVTHIRPKISLLKKKKKKKNPPPRGGKKKKKKTTKKKKREKQRNKMETKKKPN